MPSAGKRNSQTSRMPTLYDTSKCQVKFRKPRILQSRKLFFDHDRDLNFNHVRFIGARLQGVIFREESAVGFRNIGVSNIEEVMSKEDWPDVGPARSPETLKIQRNDHWEGTWGKEQSYIERWGVKRKEDSREQLYSRDRIKPQVSYHKRGARPVRTKTPARPVQEKRPTPKVEVIEEPVIAAPSSTWQPPAQTFSYGAQATSAKDKKRALLFNEYALALMDSQKYERAMTYFQKAQDLDPGEETYRINMKRCREWLEYQKRGGRR
ncbi:MAG: tetratricopeptide repeat protein [Thermoplasmatota archaeon]